MGSVRGRDNAVDLSVGIKRRPSLNSPRQLWRQNYQLWMNLARACARPASKHSFMKSSYCLRPQACLPLFCNAGRQHTPMVRILLGYYQSPMIARAAKSIRVFALIIGSTNSLISLEMQK
ncbi:MAG: hypothetical protein AAF801_09775 [Pseudomonadota bacterium]